MSAPCIAASRNSASLILIFVSAFVLTLTKEVSNKAMMYALKCFNVGVASDRNKLNLLKVSMRIHLVVVRENYYVDGWCMNYFIELVSYSLTKKFVVLLEW